MQTQRIATVHSERLCGILGDKRDGDDADRRDLERRLDLPAGSADAFDVRRTDLGPAVPIVDGAGSIVGLSVLMPHRRDLTRRSRGDALVTTERRGLFLPATLTQTRLRRRDSPLVCVPGLREAILLTSYGLDVVGMVDSCLGSRAILVDWLRRNGFHNGGAQASRAYITATGNVGDFLARALKPRPARRRRASPAERIN